jgi:ubiquinol-cytochrome c reductase cytochrome b subunit
VLFVAGGNDVLAARFDVSVNVITYILRAAALVVPVVAGLLTYRLCKELQAQGPAAGIPAAAPAAEHIVRTADGGYAEVDEPVG